MTTTTTTDAPANAVGDADGDGKIDSSDIFDIMLYVAYCAVGKDGGLTADQIAAADVDKNGKVDSTDVFYVMYYVALKGCRYTQDLGRDHQVKHIPQIKTASKNSCIPDISGVQLFLLIL